jgi:mono/diheme cytochrome c family protein
MYKPSVIALVTLSAFSLSSLVQAAGIPDPVKGYKLSQVECGGCHAVDPEPGKRVRELPARAPGAAPHFKVIAFDPAMTPEKIRDTVRLPHGEMSNVLVADEDITNIISYIGSLRRTDP